MYTTPVDPMLSTLVYNYHLTQGDNPWKDCIQFPSTDLELLTEVQDKFGWYSFVEEKILALFLQLVKTALL